MKVTLISEVGDLHNVDVEHDAKILTLQKKVAEQIGIKSISSIYLIFDGNALSDVNKTLIDYNIRSDDVIYLTIVEDNSAPNAASNNNNLSSSSAPAPAPVSGNDPSLELFRQQLLQPQVLNQLRQQIPNIESVIANDTSLIQLRNHMESLSQSQAINNNPYDNIDLEGLDPYSIEAQKKIEEAIKKILH